MKYFFDTEFIEWAGGIQLVSIGIVAEDGRKFYAESCTFDERLADPWVHANVLSKLVSRDHSPRNPWTGQSHLHIVNTTTVCTMSNPSKAFDYVFGTEQFIKECLLELLHKDKDGMPEFYAYYASYDWVVFCRIFGRMIDLPRYFPKFVRDLKQMMVERNLTQDWKRRVCPDPVGEHNALVDALWNMDLYNHIKAVDLEQHHRGPNRVL